MKAWVFAYISFYDNALIQVKTEGDTWKEAYKNGMNKINIELGRTSAITDEDVNNMPDDMEKAIDEALNSDYLFSLIEL